MEGFKTSPKMQCFKEGGAVKYKSRHSEKSEMKEDVVKDKAIVKKAVKMHDVQQHGGEKTDLAKLKKGGRMKKEGGCVGRYKSGGGVSYGAKKTKEDRKEIAAIKRMKDGGSLKEVDAEDNPGLAKLPTPVRNKMGYAKKGGTVKKYADGGMVAGDKFTAAEDAAVRRALSRPLKGGIVPDEEKARMPAGKLPQQIVDEEAMKENVETREMVAGPLRKLKQGVMEKFKSKSKTPVAPMKKGGKTCQ